METTKIYSLKEVTINLFGIDCSQGQAADGDTVSIAYSNEYLTLQKGNDGSTVYSENPNAFDAEVTIRLSQASGVWALLSAAIQTLRATGGVLTGPLLIKDNGGSTVFACPVAGVKTLPGLNFGKDSQAREIVIHAPNSVEIGGGN